MVNLDSVRAAAPNSRIFAKVRSEHADDPPIHPLVIVQLGYAYILSLEGGLQCNGIRWAPFVLTNNTDQNEYLTLALTGFAPVLHFGHYSDTHSRDISGVGRYGLYVQPKSYQGIVRPGPWGCGLEALVGVREFFSLAASFGYLDGLQYGIGIAFIAID